MEKKAEIDIINVIENEDGGATIELEVSGDSLKFFLEYAINDILRKHVDELKKDEDDRISD
jgi:hypothetical protein